MPVTVTLSPLRSAAIAFCAVVSEVVSQMPLHGAFVRAYPYPFVDVAVLGYAAALVNIVGILVLGLAMAAGFLGLERLLIRRRSR